MLSDLDWLERWQIQESQNQPENPVFPHSTAAYAQLPFAVVG